MNWTDRRRAFRAILAGEDCVHPASVFDPVSARIAEDLGFETGMFAGSVASFTVLGAPDMVVLTLTEFAEQVRRMTRATDWLPLLVDADHGYGNALSVMRTVAGTGGRRAAALTIEDTALPLPYGDGKLQAAVARGRPGQDPRGAGGADDCDLVVVGRTSALRAGGLDEAMARAPAYAGAGADALFFTGVRTAGRGAGAARCRRQADHPRRDRRRPVPPRCAGRRRGQDRPAGPPAVPRGGAGGAGNPGRTADARRPRRSPTSPRPR